MILLYSWGSFIILPGWANSDRIKKLNPVPISPDHIPKTKYKLPISLWLVEYNQREIQIFHSFTQNLNNQSLQALKACGLT